MKNDCMCSPTVEALAKEDDAPGFIDVGKASAALGMTSNLRSRNSSLPVFVPNLRQRPGCVKRAREIFEVPIQRRRVPHPRGARRVSEAPRWCGLWTAHRGLTGARGWVLSLPASADEPFFRPVPVFFVGPRACRCRSARTGAAQRPLRGPAPHEGQGAAGRFALLAPRMGEGASATD